MRRGGGRADLHVPLFVRFDPQVPVLPRRAQQHRTRSAGRRSTSQLDPEGGHHPLGVDAEIERVLGRESFSLSFVVLVLIDDADWVLLRSL